MGCLKEEKAELWLFVFWNWSVWHEENVWKGYTKDTKGKSMGIIILFNLVEGQSR